jgi:hypothetical protein
MKSSLKRPCDESSICDPERPQDLLSLLPPMPHKIPLKYWLLVNEDRLSKKRQKLDNTESDPTTSCVEDPVLKRRRKVSFSCQAKKVYQRYYSDEDLKNAWLSEDDALASRHMLFLAIQAQSCTEVCFRGLEDFKNERTTQHKIRHGCEVRRSILHALRSADAARPKTTTDTTTAAAAAATTTAARVSAQLSMASVKQAQELAIVDACIAKLIHGGVHHYRDDNLSRPTIATAANYGPESTSMMPTEMLLVGKYGLFSRRRQTKRMFQDDARDVSVIE